MILIEIGNLGITRVQIGKVLHVPEEYVPDDGDGVDVGHAVPKIIDNL